jgi:hypothetical protein
MIFVIFRITKILIDMKLTDRLNVLIQAATLSQKSGILTLDEAVTAKSAIDVISAGTLNQNFTAAINVLIELAVASQKKGAYSLKDAYMIYLAVEGIEGELQNEVNRINGTVPNEVKPTQEANNGENIITVPPKKLKKNS